MGDKSTNMMIQGKSIQALIDPRFDALISRATLATKTNQVGPEGKNDISLIDMNSSPIPDSTSQKVDKQSLLSLTCKNRLQGLLIGLAVAAISVAIVLAVLLTRPSSSSSSSTTSTSTVSSCNTLQWNPIGITLIGNGSNGSVLNQLDTPGAVFVDASDVVYIADSNNHRVLNLSSSTNGTISATVVAGITGVSILSSATLNSPMGIFVDSQKNLYIADTAHFRVQYWLHGALNGSTVAGSSTGIYGTTIDRLGYNYGLYVDKSNNIYVSDTVNNRVVKWSAGASIGVLVAGNGSLGYGPSQLGFPLGITVDSQSGTMYITDFLLHTIVSWSSGAAVGTIVAGLNSTQGNIPSLLRNPWGVIRDSYGNMYVSDYGNHRVQMFCAIGSSFSSGKTIAGVGIGLLSSTGLYLPAGIAFDSQMNLYVADSGNHRVQKFLRIK